MSVNNHSGDFVGNILGGNGDIIEGVLSGIGMISLFEPGLKPNLKKIADSPSKILTDLPTLFDTIYSPHSIYLCDDSSCNYNK